MRYLEIAKEKGESWDGCNGSSIWTRFVHIVTANTKRELREEKKKIEEEIKGKGSKYVSVSLGIWQTLEEYNATR